MRKMKETCRYNRMQTRSTDVSRRSHGSCVTLHRSAASGSELVVCEGLALGFFFFFFFKQKTAYEIRDVLHGAAHLEERIASALVPGRIQQTFQSSHDQIES